MIQLTIADETRAVGSRRLLLGSHGRLGSAPDIAEPVGFGRGSMRESHVLFVAVILIAAACGSSTGGTATTTPPSPATADTPTTTKPDFSTVDDPLAERRWVMVESQIEGRGVRDPAVLEAMRTVPRHEFVPERIGEVAYGDRALPIGYGQTISQPYIVGLMSELLEIEPGEKVLEIGTGSGYQAAVLAEMGVDVYSIEIVPELAAEAASRFIAFGYPVTTLTADGYFGWEEHAPFDAIIVTAAPDHVPQPLVNQLGPGGRMVIPIGPVGAVQTMWKFTVDETGEVVGERVLDVRFVPFTRAEE
jgi:protein-L-isoaspartate(D-aspartate) O-methyltransferase